MRKVYLIVKYNLTDFSKDVEYAYLKKPNAKKKVDALNDSVTENEDVDYRLEPIPIEDDEDEDDLK